MEKETTKWYFKFDIDILNNKYLNMTEKVLLNLIIHFSKLKGYCWASNKQIAELCALSEKTVQSAINKLLKLNYISKWKQKKGKIVYRIITTNQELFKSNNDLKNFINKVDIELIDYDWLTESLKEVDSND